MAAAAAVETPEALVRAAELDAQGQTDQAAATLLAFINNQDVEAVSYRDRESALVALCDLYKKRSRLDAVQRLIQDIKPFLAAMPKARTAKTVRTLLDSLADLPDAVGVQVALCTEAIEWSKADKRTFLRQSLETRLVGLYLQSKQYTEAIALISTLLRELKRLDDKMMLVEVHLLESRIYLELRNVAKSRAALTAARSSANSVYTPPLIQAALDMQSGILHAEEKDFKTGFSYFYETLEGYSTQEDPRAVLALKYMILCKIMLNSAEDVVAILNGKTALKYAGPEVDAMRAVSKAAKNRSLKEFEAAVQAHPRVLSDDPMVKSHLNDLYNTLLEQNLSRLIEPFSRVEIAHIAELIDLPVRQVENKLSQMILDKKLHGIVDQGSGCLIIFSEPKDNKTYTAALQTMNNMNKVMDSLFKRTAKLS